MRVVKLSILIVTILYSCSSVSKPVLSKGNYKIIKYKSQDGGTYLDITSFDHSYKSEKLPALYKINHIIFFPSRSKKLTLPVEPGKFKIRIGMISKKWETISDLTIKKGDSTSIKVYLEDDPKPLY